MSIAITAAAILVGFFILSLIVGEPMGKTTLDKRSQRKHLQSQGPCTCYDSMNRWTRMGFESCPTHGPNKKAV